MLLKGSSAGPVVVESRRSVRLSAICGAQVRPTIGRKASLDGTVVTAHPSQPNLRTEHAWLLLNVDMESKIQCYRNRLYGLMQTRSCPDRKCQMMSIHSHKETTSISS